MAKTPPRPGPVDPSAVAGLLTCLALGPAAAAQDARRRRNGLLGPWAATAEVSYVVTGGNTSTSALSLGTSFTRKWTKDTLLFKSLHPEQQRPRRRPGPPRGRRPTSTSSRRRSRARSPRTISWPASTTVASPRSSPARPARAGTATASPASTTGSSSRPASATSGSRSPGPQVKTSAGLTYTRRQYVGQDMESFAGFRFEHLRPTGRSRRTRRSRPCSSSTTT